MIKDGLIEFLLDFMIVFLIVWIYIWVIMVVNVYLNNIVIFSMLWFDIVILEEFINDMLICLIYMVFLL